MATYNAKTLTLVNQNGDVFVIDPLQGNESVYLDLPVTIAQNQWSGTAPYTYTYTNSHITANAALCVYFKDGVREGLVGDLKWSKATGSITFVTTEHVAGPVPLVVRVIDSTTNGTYPVDASMIETDAVVGETTVQGVLEDLDSRITSMWETIYPVGSIYMSVASTSPGTLFGGTWERLKSRFLLGAEDAGDTTGNPYVGGETGGNSTHTLTTDEMPSHNHTFTGSAVTSSNISDNHTHTGTSGNQSANHTHSGPSHSHSINSDNIYHWVNSGGGFANGDSGSKWKNQGWSGSTNAAGTGATGSNSVDHTHTTTTGNQSTGHTHSVTAAGTIGNSGGGTAFSIMPPYLAVYMWKRTA